MKKLTTATVKHIGTTTCPQQTIALPDALAEMLAALLADEKRRRGPNYKSPTAADCVAAFCLMYEVDRDTAVDAVDAVIDHSCLDGYTSR